MTEPTPPHGARDALRKWRAAEARRRNMPAFRVLSNATLDALAVECPRTIEALDAIPGVGPVTLDAYGLELLALLAPHEPEPAPAPGIPAWEEVPGALDPHAPPGTRIHAMGADALALEVPTIERTVLARVDYERLVAALAESRGRWVRLDALGFGNPRRIARVLSRLAAFEVAGQSIRVRRPGAAERTPETGVNMSA